MRLFVLRHGQAEPYNTDDGSRQLVDAGRAEVRAVVAKSLMDLVGLESIWASPLVRAQQTAQLVQAQLERPAPVSTSHLLIPEANPGELIDALQATRMESLLLASHQPFVGRLLDLLCGTVTGSHFMPTGALACIDLPFPAAGIGRLIWCRHASSL